MKTVIVIGGGASGMAAAVSCAESARVILLEKNEKLGKKIFITGKGRCNLTNDEPMTVHQKNVITNPRFLYSSYAAFTKDDIKDFLMRYGCPVKTERGSRVFPVSDHASDVTKAFERALHEKNVDIRLNTAVKKVVCENGRFSYVETNRGRIDADTCIICTGGLSYESTGSTGDGYRFAESLGHKVVNPLPSLVPLETEEPWVSELSGLGLKNVSVKFFGSKKKPVYEDFGELLFTHFGVSGPVVLSASGYLTKLLDKEEKIRLVIDLKPALDAETLDKRLLRDFEKAQNKSIKNALTELLPQSLIPVILQEADIDPDKKVNIITKQERASLRDTLKGLTLHITGTRGFNEAVITQGGVNVKEIDPSTMESRIVKHLYFAGEVLDVDAMTGGFNLQIAWSTGTLAGLSAGKEEKKMSFNVAIDGPAGAGKSTIAKAVAKRLNFIYVDTGAMYRAIGLYYLDQGIDIRDPEACKKALPEISVTIAHEEGVQQIYLNGENVSSRIRTQEVGEAASVTSAYPEVREKLLNLQRELAASHDVLMDGRDIGTTILPNADLKVYLTASSLVRAERRYKELIEKGEDAVLEDIQKEIEERDQRDMNREVSPLRKADDAVEVDSSFMNKEEVTDAIVALIEERRA